MSFLPMGAVSKVAGKVLGAAVGAAGARIAGALAKATDALGGSSMLARAARAGEGGAVRFGSALRATGAFRPGVASGGSGLGRLEGARLRVSERGLARVESHLSQFDANPANDAMIARLRGALGAGQSISGADAVFYTHELSEATLMGRGMSYEAAHAAALEKYGVSPFSVYAPEVVAQLPEWFNENWSNFWASR